MSMRMIRISPCALWILAGFIALGCGGSSGQPTQPTQSMQPGDSEAKSAGDESGGDTAPQATESEAKPADDLGSRCARLLERFGADAVSNEQAACVEALTEGREAQQCREAGLYDDYSGCFDSCMNSLDLGDEGYDPSEPASSPVDNCRLGCHQTTCQEQQE
jgi:hypothetical protein